MKQLEATLICEQCERTESEPYDVGDTCICGGRFRENEAMWSWYCKGCRGTCVVQGVDDQATRDLLAISHRYNEPYCKNPQLIITKKGEKGFEIMLQEYFCPYCGINGAVLIPKEIDVMSVVNLLDDDHKQQAPGCTSPASGLRVRTEASAEKDRGAIVTYQYLTFVKIEQKKKTSVWRIDDRSGNELGRAMFYPPWKQYCVEATSPAIYSAGCLADMMTFLATSERTRRSGIEAAHTKPQQEKTW